MNGVEPDRAFAANCRDPGAFEVRSESVERTEALGASVGRVVREAWPAVPGPLLFLEGPLGAGKTAFVRGVARGLGLAVPAKSPTFAIHLVYPGAPGLQHIDLYRLRAGADLDELGLRDLFAAHEPVAVEWPDRLGDPDRLDAALGARLVRIRFEPGADEGERRLIVTAAERWLRCFGEAPVAAPAAPAAWPPVAARERGDARSRD